MYKDSFYGGDTHDGTGEHQWNCTRRKPFPDTRAGQDADLKYGSYVSG